MGEIGNPCSGALAVARGDDRDPDNVREHLRECTPCSQEIVALRELAISARAALLPSAAGRGFVREIVHRVGSTHSMSWWSPSFALAAGSAAAVILLSFPLLPTDGSAVVLADLPEPAVTIHFRQPVGERLAFEIIDRSGVRHGESLIHRSSGLPVIQTSALLVETY